MNITSKMILCDLVMPSLRDVLSGLVENNLLMVIVLLVVQLLVATIVIMIVVSRKKSRDEKRNANYQEAEEGALWKE